jgi:hypothetical protein
VSGELSLFGSDEPDVEQAQLLRPDDSIADWLVDAIREALTARGLTTMTERQQAVEAITGRPVESLRALTRAEALRVISELSPTTATEAGSTSAWDHREGDTWIDRL